MKTRCIALLGVLLILLSGCGGGGSKETVEQGMGRGTARISFLINWPAPSRLVPDAAGSIKITLRKNGAVLDERVLARPAGGGETTATFENLPLGEAIATASAHPTPEGTGTAQATASVAVMLEPGANPPLRLTMGSTIERVQVTPASPSFEIGAPSTLELAASALDVSGQVVLTSGARWTWISDNPSVVSLTPAGDRATARRESVGTATVTATETESGKSVQVIVTARGDVAAGYTITDLGTLPGYVDSAATALNNNGQVVGNAGTSNGATHAFFWTPETGMADLGTGSALDINDAGQVVGAPNFLWTAAGGRMPISHSASGINNNGQMVGTQAFYFYIPRGHTQYPTIINEYQAFVWTPGSPIVYLGGTSASRINDNGQIIGQGGDRATLWTLGGGRMDLGLLPNSNQTIPRSINNNGQVVGSAVGALGLRAFLWTASSGMTNLGGGWSFAAGINDAGLVVGGAETSSGWRAVVWSTVGNIIDLNSLIPSDSGWVLQGAIDINNRGQIVGTGEHNGQRRAFLLTPQ